MNSFNSLRNLSLGAIFFIRRDSFLLPTRGVEVFGDLWKIAHAASFCRKSKTLPGSRQLLPHDFNELFCNGIWVRGVVPDD